MRGAIFTSVTTPADLFTRAREPLKVLAKGSGSALKTASRAGIEQGKPREGKEGGGG